MDRVRTPPLVGLCLAACLTGCGEAPASVVIVGGTIVDGSGDAPHAGTVVIEGDRIVSVGEGGREALDTIDATGMVVAPGYGAATASLTGIIVAPPGLEGLDAFRRQGRQGRTEEGMAELKRALGDPGSRAVLREAGENGIDGGFAWLKATGYSSMRITGSADYPELVGAYLSEIAEERGQDPFDAVADLVIGADRPVNLTLGAIKEHDVRRLMVQRWNMIASDGGYADGSDSPAGHPRSAGTFPRLLGHYVRDTGVLSLEEAVRKITSLPADFHGIDDRGRLVVGARADIAVFDPATIIDRSDWDYPQRFAEGVIHVFVNGIPVLRDGEMTGEAPGEVVQLQPGG